ncbi:saccharopine dehydrogenase NADP-binding domain-containing protein [Candidatus Parcubacteria bacterium]|nr:saccharopine dehydrogenase NADP-binding domain-containing protein [Candidatus Parcubacteria bacterium]
MTYDFLIIGSSGMQGRIVTRDLIESGHKVHLADLYKEGSEENLKKFPGTEFSFVDLRDQEHFKTFVLSIDAPIVINCAEGDWNQEVYKVCLDLKRHVIDLGSDIPTTKAQYAMSEDFKKAGLVAITGCGSTPGINNVMMRYASQFFSEIDTIEIGFAWDSNIKEFVVPFSIPSIIEELSDPAAVLENGQWFEKNPPDTEEIREFREIGQQKCYLVRHPETWSFYEDYKDLKPRNIRFYAGFPDHSLAALNMMIDLGMGEEDPVTIEKIQVKPVDAVARVLTKLGRPEHYNETENLWVTISGKDKKGETYITHMECIVFTLPGWEDAGCNIDTGLPASIMAQMIKDGRVTERGSFAPDLLIPPLEFFKELRKKGLTVYQDGQPLNAHFAEEKK